MIGQTISHYKILEKLGEGGMGVVYKAQDTKLDRLVALKFLPTQLAASEQDKARFVQEAKAASAINHPNICTIYSIEDHEGQLFIAMEFVDGRTLRDRKEGTSVKQAIEIGIQIADGLAAAHEKGIVHRDIKPENIMVRKDGIVQIMDFGLAKLRGVSRLTKEGSTVGTAGYMSPEQVQGLDADHRSDVFSLGALLHELLTGRLPFKGVHETALMYEIVNVDAVPPSSLVPEIEPELDRIILECLQKEPDERCQSAKEVSRDLKRYKRESGRQRVSRISSVQPLQRPIQSTGQMSVPNLQTVNVQTPAGQGKSTRVWMGIAAALFVALGVAVYAYWRATTIEVHPVRATLLPPDLTSFNSSNGGNLMVSPDGHYLAFVATDSVGNNQLFVRALSSISALPLPGTENATYPFWSYDSRSMAFFAGGKLKRVDVAGGPVTTICDATQGRGGSWNHAGVIIFAPASEGPIHRVAAAGGASIAITNIDTSKNETSHRWPFFLPDGKHFLFTSQMGGGIEGVISVGSVEDSSRKNIINVVSNAEFNNGYLLYVHQNNLIAHPFDPGKAELTGDPVPIAERIIFGDARSRGAFSSSQNGVLVYQSGKPQDAQMFLVDRRGNILTKLKSKSASYWAVLSHDGKRIVQDAFDVSSRSNDIWLYDLARDISTRFTFDPKDDAVPVFSPDGNKVIFSSDRKGTPDIFLKDLNGMKNEEFVYGSPLQDYPTSWSPDGKSVLLSLLGSGKTKWDLALLPLTGDKIPVPLTQTEFNEWVGIFSPDGRWVSYQSDESGKYEIYVRTLDAQGGKWQVSVGGGESAFWPRKSKEIIYTSGGRKVVSAEVKYTASSFEVVRTTVLFDLNIRGVGTFMHVSEDGQRFLLRIASVDESSTPVTLVMNWNEELKKK